MEERSVIFDDVSPITDELLSSPSGLQLLFAFLDLGRARHRASFLQTLEGNIERMLSSPNGCSILAHLISENPVTQDVPPSIIEELLTLDMHRLAVDRHASSVLFAVIESGSDEHRVRTIRTFFVAFSYLCLVCTARVPFRDDAQDRRDRGRPAPPPPHICEQVRFPFREAVFH